MNQLEAKLVKQLLGKTKFGVEDIVVVAALLDMAEDALKEPEECSENTEIADESL
jgi:hypothetical protein